MRQLKGKVKESKKERRERREDNVKNKGRIITIVVPILVGIMALIIAYVYLHSRPKETTK